MRLSDILKIQHIKVPLLAQNKRDAIAEMVQLLSDASEVKDSQMLLSSVLDREATRTTGIGNGLAIPHGKCTAVDHLVVAIAKPQRPIDFESIDGRPVDLIVLLASPPDQTGPHIQALAKIVRLMNMDAFRQAMRDATSPEQILDAVKSQEEGMAVA